MNNDVNLTPSKILNKEFNVDFKGYNPQEVDHFLDVIVSDYNAFASLINQAYDKIDELEELLAVQKQKITSLEKENTIKQDSINGLEENISSNVDILKRLSLLEKAVFQKNM